jgi:hypothetical protein
MRKYTGKIQWYLRGGPLFVLLSIAGRFQTGRAIALRLYRRFAPAHAPDSIAPESMLVPVEPATAAHQLDRDGVCSGLHLSGQAHAELRDALCELPCFGEGHPNFPFFYRDKQSAERRYGTSFLLAHYYNFDKTVAAAARLARDPLLLSIARVYFGAEPVLVGMRAWWSFAGSASVHEQVAAGQSFHYDIDDYRSMAVFFYLTDVDAAGGPHVCIRGSHRFKKLRHVLAPLRSRTDEELVHIYGSDAIVPLCGPAGWGFAEDTFCFHKGLHPEKSDRLTLQLRFGIRDYGRASDEANVSWATAAVSRNAEQQRS